MKYIDLTLPTPPEDLACDEVLLDLCEEGLEGELLRFWEPQQPFVVLGYANQAGVEADLAACEARQVGVFRRCSGGGTVLQGAGCLNYSLILRIAESGPLQTITGTNQFILERQRAALQPLLPAPVEIQGHTDLVMGNLKFSGNAQRRKRKFLIFHGTFLLNFHLPLIEQVLRMPSKQPDYRQSRSHNDFLTNLNLAPDEVKQSLRRVWGAKEPLLQVPGDRINHLSVTKYSTADWNLRF
jgi:lipoate-protein ligase A